MQTITTKNQSSSNSNAQIVSRILKSVQTQHQ